jgi:hypothetical protein
MSGDVRKSMLAGAAVGAALGVVLVVIDAPLAWLVVTSIVGAALAYLLITRLGSETDLHYNEQVRAALEREIAQLSSQLEQERSPEGQLETTRRWLTQQRSLADFNLHGFDFRGTELRVVDLRSAHILGGDVVGSNELARLRHLERVFDEWLELYVDDMGAATAEVRHLLPSLERLEFGGKVRAESVRALVEHVEGFLRATQDELPPPRPARMPGAHHTTSSAAPSGAPAPPPPPPPPPPPAGSG